MSLSSNVSALATRVATEIKAVRGEIASATVETVARAPEPLEVVSDSYFYTDGASFDLVTLPTTPAGAVLILIQGDDWGTLAGMVAPTGTAGTWTERDAADRGADATHLKVWTRTVSVAGAQTVTVHQNATAASEFYGALYVMPPGSVVEAVDAVTDLTTVSHEAPSVTATGAHQLVISAWLNEYSGVVTYGPPPGVERSRVSEAGGSLQTLLTATSETTAAGATGPRTVRLSAARPYVAATILVSQPAATVPLTDRVASQAAVERRARWVSAYPVAPPVSVTAGVSTAVLTSQSVSGALVNLPTPRALTLGAHVDIGSPDPSFLFPQNVTPNTLLCPWALEFYSDAPLLNLYCRAVGQAVVIYVDGQQVGDLVTFPGGGGLGYLEVGFGAVRRQRHFRFESDDLRAGGILLGQPGDSVIGPARSGPRVAVVGDSYTEGVVADYSFTGYPWVMGRRLGWRDVWASGSGGTGYLSVNGARPKYRDRIHHDVLDHHPDVVIVTGGRNDAAFTHAAVYAEAVLLFEAIIAAGADLVVVGPWYHGDPDQWIFARRNVLWAACDAVGGLFLDPLAPPLVTGSGNTGSVSGTGNSDFLISADAVHPTQDGHDAMGNWLAARLAEAWR